MASTFSGHLWRWGSSSHIMTSNRLNRTDRTLVKKISSRQLHQNIQKHNKHHLSLMLVVSNAEPSSGGRSERSRWTITALKDTPGISPDFKEPAMTCPIDPKPTRPIDRDSTRRLLFSCPAVDIARKDRGQVDHNQLRWTKRPASILNHSQN